MLIALFLASQIACFAALRNQDPKTVIILIQPEQKESPGYKSEKPKFDLPDKFGPQTKIVNT